MRIYIESHTHTFIHIHIHTYVYIRVYTHTHTQYCRNVMSSNSNQSSFVEQNVVRVASCYHALHDWETFSASLQPWQPLKRMWRTEKSHEQFKLKWPKQLLIVLSKLTFLNHTHTQLQPQFWTDLVCQLAPTLLCALRLSTTGGAKLA